ncbi:MAG: DUF6220 domain-containing protein [Solirubrobacteraceae bacterium]
MEAHTSTHPAGGVAQAHRILALIVFGGGILQFLLAGYAAFGGSSYDAHAGIGTLITVLALIVLILAFVGRREAVPASALLLGLLVLQNIFGAVGNDAPALGALHAVNGLLILGAAMAASAGRPIGRPHGRARA